MTADLVVGVHPGREWTGWIVLRGQDVVAGGTWRNPASVGVDGRLGVTPPPSPVDLAALLAEIGAVCGGESPLRVAVSPVALPGVGPSTGRTSKRALLSLPAIASIYGAICGHWAGLVTVVDPAEVAPSDLPSALKTPARKGASGPRTVRGGHRGSLAEVRTAYALTIAWSAEGTIVHTTPASSLAEAPIMGKGSPGRIDPAAFRATMALSRLAPPEPVESAPVGKDQGSAYVEALIAVVSDAAPATAAELNVACEDALALVARPPGVSAPTAEGLARVAPGAANCTS